MTNNKVVNSAEAATLIRERPLSPCVQICRIDSASQLCEGCGRTLNEIACWGRMTEDDKAPVWERLEAEGFVGTS